MAAEKKLRLLALGVLAIIAALDALAAGDMPDFRRNLDLAHEHLDSFNTDA